MIFKIEKSFKLWFAHENKKLEILSLPKYDAKTDSFVDGPLPKSVDSFFDNQSKVREFFQIKKHVHHDEASHGYGH